MCSDMSKIKDIRKLCDFKQLLQQLIITSGKVATVTVLQSFVMKPATLVSLSDQGLLCALESESGIAFTGRPFGTWYALGHAP